jgi:hypothetical protein
MKLKVFPLMLGAVGALYGPNINKKVEVDDVYKATNTIWIKNLNIYSDLYMNKPNVSKVICFDIVFHSTSLSYQIYAESDATDAKLVTKPSFQPDWRQGMQYQRVEIDLKSSFTNYITDGDVVRITYGNILLFDFKCPARLQPINSFRYNSTAELPKNKIFNYEVNLPCIKNGRIEDSFMEQMDFTYFDFDSIQNYYYGKFPDEYMWVRFDTTQFNNFVNGENLVVNNEGYDLESVIYFYEKNLFINYHEKNSSNLDDFYQLHDFFKPIRTINGYHNLAYCNHLKKVTFQDGTMRIKSELNEYVLRTRENKDSKYLTFPLDLENFEENYNFAKNMKIAMHVTGGALKNFEFYLNMNLNLRKDFFYNHINETLISGTHNNKDLDTIDIIYA